MFRGCYTDKIEEFRGHKKKNDIGWGKYTLNLLVFFSLVPALHYPRPATNLPLSFQ